MLNKLKIGNKYTIVGNDGWLEFKMQVTLLDYMYKQYAQHEAVPYITFKKKGGRKVYKMYLNYVYTIIEGWHDIEMHKNYKIDPLGKWESCERMKYNELDFSNYNVVCSGKCGEIEPYRSYESLIDYSFDFGLEYGVGSEEYIQHMKSIFRELNFSLSNDMINYYKQEHPYFMDTIEQLKYN